MKEIRTIRMVEQTDVKFVADDGKEFVGENAERDCMNYERTRDRKKVEEAFARLDFTEFKMPFIDWFSEENGFYRIVLNSKKDFVAMNDYFKIVWNVFDNEIAEPINYPCTKLIYYSYGYVGDYTRDLKAELLTALDQF